jgi:hypothetical protein
MTNELTIKKNNEIVFNDLDEDLMLQMSEDASDFQHNVDGEDITTPRLKLLQPISPELTKGDAKFVAGAEAGDMYEVISKTIYKAEEGILFIPVKTIVNYIEWEGVGKNSKLINNFGSDATFYMKQKNANKINEKGKVIGSADNRTIIKSLNYYGFIFSAENSSVSPVVIPFSGSKMKVARNFNTLILSKKDKQGNALPSFAFIYKLKSLLEANEKGTFANYDLSQVGMTLAIKEVGQVIYNQAKELYNILNEANLNLAFKDEDESEPSNDGRM